MDARKRKTVKKSESLPVPDELNFLIEKRSDGARRQGERRARPASEPSATNRRERRERRQGRRRGDD